MKSKLQDRNWLLAQLPSVLYGLALTAGTASVGHTEDISAMTITAERPVATEALSTYRNEVQTRARVAVWETRFSALSDLELKLNNSQPSSVRLAGNFTGNSG
ncbi:MAG: hypothetical protein ACE5G3_00725 [Gammaproteobacteria bacterium]